MVNWEFIIGVAGIIVAIATGFYKIHRDIIKDRVEIEKRLATIEERLKHYKLFFDSIEKIFLQDFENKLKNKKEGEQND